MAQKKSGAHVHILIAKTAQDMTRELYDATMQNDVLYAEWRRQHPGASPKGLEESFVKKYWPAAIEPARATLAHLLTVLSDEGLRDQIADALILDKQLMHGRQSGAQLLGTAQSAN